MVSEDCGLRKFRELPEFMKKKCAKLFRLQSLILRIMLKFESGI